MTRVAVLMASHNRVESTTRFLEVLFSRVPDGCELVVFLVDDASSDGTADRVKQMDLSVNVIAGTGALYWSGGMRLASLHAQRWHPDLVVWANDDLVLAEGSLERTLNLYEAGQMENCVWVGNVADRSGEFLAYGGRLQRPDNLVSFAICSRADMGVEVDSLNGNFVAFDSKVYFETLGGFPSQYRHAYSDLVIGLRARRAGLAVRTLPFVVGFDERNPRTGRMFDRTLPLVVRVRSALSVFGLPVVDHWAFCREVAGFWRGPVLFMRSYVRVIIPK